MKFIFVTGGVVSSLGKGIAVASLAALLQARGYRVRMRKLDPYLNVDPGTMSPCQHGEVFITDDGAETDLDLGYYERFTGINAKRTDSLTSGKIYSTLLQRERRGEYLGNTVQVIPHITNLIKEFILSGIEDLDFLLCEIGGTVGDIEGLPFFEAIRQLGYEIGKEKTTYIHLTLVPYLAAAKELKTKPSQHSIKELRSIGIQPDIIVCRADRIISEQELNKIALFSNLPAENIISAIDSNNVYEAPLEYHKAGLDKAVLRNFKLLEQSTKPNLENWYKILDGLHNYDKEITIALVGKYNQLQDAYKSLLQAFEHAGIYLNCKVNIKWIDTACLENEENCQNLEEIFREIHGIMVPGGFGDRGIESKILAIRYARENNIPFFGICLGMQLALVEYARNVLKIKDANSTEFSDNCTPIIALLQKWDTKEKKCTRSREDDLGGTMRLGAYDCIIKEDSIAHHLYKTPRISERHRHRYEFNMEYTQHFFDEGGMLFSGISPDKTLLEMIELPKHRYFVASQFHPEFKSRPLESHPLFIGFIKAALKYGKKEK